MTVWNASKIQFAWFLVSVNDLSAAEVFESLFVQSPDSEQRNKIINPSAPFYSKGSGEINGKMATVQISPGRIDLVLEPMPSKEDPTIPREVMGVIDSIQFTLSCIKNLESIDNKITGATRLSIVLDTSEQFPTQLKAEETYYQLTNINLNPQGNTDLLFRLNSRTKINGEIEINRVMQLSTETKRTFTIQIRGDEVGNVGLPVLGDEEHLCCLHLDFNTVPTGVQFDHSDTHGLFSMIAEEVVEASKNRKPTEMNENE